jgi:rubrerythrin
MERFSVREVVEMALQTERLGYQFYTEMSEKFQEDEKLKDLFDILAKEEMRHEHVFEGLLSRVNEDEPGGWDEAQPYFRAMVESEFFLGKGKSLPEMGRIKTALDAAEFALRFEKETALFFNGLKQTVKEKDVVEDIIREEARHIAWLSKYRETLKD